MLKVREKFEVYANRDSPKKYREVNGLQNRALIPIHAWNYAKGKVFQRHGICCFKVRNDRYSYTIEILKEWSYAPVRKPFYLISPKPIQ